MIVEQVVAWYATSARDLPWRAEGVSPYGVLVSEVMLQQTPVARVVPAWLAWTSRWPDASTLAGAPSGDAVRQWDRLGYPRRALRLHAACTVIRDRHGGIVPDTVEGLEALPGIGTYTARAVAAFAHGQRVPVVDVNVRRVLARSVEGVADGPPAVSRRDLALVEALLPAESRAAATASVALMELGALLCTARQPRCGQCPVRGTCAWQLAGCPVDAAAPVRRGQPWAGTDRQVRGRLMAVLRASADPVSARELDAAWDEPVQRARALDTLVADGLVDPLPDGSFALPGNAVAGPARAD